VVQKCLNGTEVGWVAPNRTFGAHSTFGGTFGVTFGWFSPAKDWDSGFWMALKRHPKVRFWHSTHKCGFCTGHFLGSDPGSLLERNGAKQYTFWEKGGSKNDPKRGQKVTQKCGFLFHFMEGFGTTPNSTLFDPLLDPFLTLIWGHFGTPFETTFGRFGFDN